MNTPPSSPAGFWKPNLGKWGRWLRGAMGAVLVIAGLVVVNWQGVLGVILLASGAFVLFEAFRGWCVLRACGLRTRI